MTKVINEKEKKKLRIVCTQCGHTVELELKEQMMCYICGHRYNADDRLKWGVNALMKAYPSQMEILLKNQELDFIWNEWKAMLEKKN